MAKEVAGKEDEVASVEIVKAEVADEADEVIIEGRNAAVVFELIEAVVEVVSRSSRKIEPHAAN